MDLKKIGKIVFLSYFFSFLSFILGYLIRVIATRFLTTSDIGLAYFLIYISQFFSRLFDFGSTKAVILLVNGAKNEKEKEKAISNYLIFQVLNFFFVFLLFLFLSPFFRKYFNLNNLAYKLLIILVFIYFIHQMFQVTFFLKINPVLEKILSFFRMLLIFSAFLVLLLFFKNYFSLTLAFIFGELFVSIFLVYYFFRFFYYNYLIFDKKVFFQIIKKGFLFLFIALSAYLMYYVDSFLLGHFLSKEYYAYYNYAYSFLSFPNFLFLTLSAYLFPISSLLSKNKAKLKVYSIKIFKLLLFIVLPFSLAFAIFSKEIILVLFTQKFLFSASILVIFSIFLPFKIFNDYFQQILDGLKKLKEVFFVYSFAVLFNFLGDYLVLSSELDTLLKLKLVALITSFSWLFVFLAFFVVLKKELKLKFNFDSVVYLVKIFLINFAFILFLFLLKKLLLIQNLWLKFFLIAIFSIPVYLLLSFFLKTIPEDLILLYLEVSKTFEKLTIIKILNEKIKKFYFN